MFRLTWYTYTSTKRVEYFNTHAALLKRVTFLTLKGHLAYVEA